MTGGTASVLASTMAHSTGTYPSGCVRCMIVGASAAATAPGQQLLPVSDAKVPVIPEDHPHILPMDVVDRSVRSRMMAGIGPKHTKPELLIRRALHREGFRFRLHHAGLPGKPDIVLKRWSAVVEVRGCFWHRHPGCRFATTPATRPEFWQAKFEANIARDARNVRLLSETGWRVAVVWECGLRSDRAERTVDSLIRWLRSDRRRFVSRLATEHMEGKPDAA